MAQAGVNSKRRSSVRMNSVENILDSSLLNRSNMKNLEKETLNISNSSSNKSGVKSTINEILVTTKNELLR